MEGEGEWRGGEEGKGRGVEGEGRKGKEGGGYKAHATLCSDIRLCV